MDSYFPFDPFDLPRSGASVERLYRTWKEVAVKAIGDSDDEDSDEDEMASEEDDEEEDTDDDTMGESPLSDHLSPRMIPRPNGPAKGKNALGSSADRRRLLKAGGELSSSFDGMSISPRFSGGLGGKAK